MAPPGRPNSSAFHICCLPAVCPEMGAQLHERQEAIQPQKDIISV